MAAARVSIPQAQTPLAPATSAGGDVTTGGALFDRVRSIVQQIRPAVQADGGDVELVDLLADGTARVRFKGACIGCPSSNLTLHMGIERAVRQSVPEISRVIAVN